MPLISSHRKEGHQVKGESRNALNRGDLKCSGGKKGKGQNYVIKRTLKF